MPIPVKCWADFGEGAIEVVGYQATSEELTALNAYRRSPEGRAERKAQLIAHWRAKLEKAKEELRKLGEVM